jgi:hypothetical protein
LAEEITGSAADFAAGVCSSVVIILAETEWERFLQYFAFMDFWIVSATDSHP